MVCTEAPHVGSLQGLADPGITALSGGSGVTRLEGLGRDRTSRKSLGQLPDGGSGKPAVPAKGHNVGQPALFGPPRHGLRRHMEQAPDLGCKQVLRSSRLPHGDPPGCNSPTTWTLSSFYGIVIPVAR